MFNIDFNDMIVFGMCIGSIVLCLLLDNLPTIIDALTWSFNDTNNTDNTTAPEPNNNGGLPGFGNGLVNIDFPLIFLFVLSVSGLLSSFLIKIK
jgi:H+/gluconate symporter-like permease